MYGKQFESLYHGSMWGAGIAVFAVWGYAIAHTKKSRVELNPRELAALLGGTMAEIEDAIKFLLQPDPQSRNKEYDGCRMIKEGEFQYFLPSWEAYHKIQNADDLRDYNRDAKRRSREKQAKKKETRRHALTRNGEIGNRMAEQMARRGDSQEKIDSYQARVEQERSDNRAEVIESKLAHRHAA